jgi:CMP-N-acetylneuraminic acid synthetase
MKILTIIPARRDSKGIPGKNWKPLGGKPLIAHTIEAALEVSSPEDICISTNAD